MKSHAIQLAARPVGWPKESDFALVASETGEPGEGQVLVRNAFLSVDPYMRGRMNDVKSYTPPFALNEAMTGGAVGRVIASRHPGFQAGDAVSSNFGWREAFVADGAAVQKIDGAAAPISAYLGVLGMPGMTAYVGLLDIGQPKPGETVLVSAAAGAVGSIVGQIARIKGCRVVGSVGSQAKVDHLLNDLGFDAAFNYKEVDLEQALAETCPTGIDVYFENVGGDHLQAALNHMNMFGRISACGMISQYNNAAPVPGPNNLTLIVRGRLTLKGFIISDHLDRASAFRADVGAWLNEGTLHNRETVIEGIENAPRAFLGLLKGENLGKMLVRVDSGQ